MSNIDLSLLIAISRTHSALFRNIEKSLKEYDLSVSEFGVLEFLYHKGEHPVQVIANKILVTSGTITYIISQLIKKGLVTKVKCPNDQRIFYINLTELGHSLISEIFPIHEAFLKKQFGNLEDDKKAMLVEVLFSLKENIEQN